jgi:ATP-dependent Clp protease protease subunit
MNDCVGFVDIGRAYGLREDRTAQGARENHLAWNLLWTRAILISEGIDHKLTDRVISQLILLDNDNCHKTIRILINSPGDNPDDGFAIYDAIRYVRSKVQLVNVGVAASAATLVMMAADKESRFSFPIARMMIHQPSGTHPQSQAEDIKRWAEEMLKMRERVNQLYAAETGKPIEVIREDTDRDFWMNAEEAMAYGLISGIITAFAELEV